MSRDGLKRMVVRVPHGLDAVLDLIAGRPRVETGLSYAHAAIVRGLIDIGLATVAKEEGKIAYLFLGVRIPRGRKKKGTTRP